MLLPLPQEPNSCLCFYGAFVIGALLILTFQMLKMLKYHNYESASDIPPGNRGLPLIGETIQFMAAIKSSKGFYDFVPIRRLRYGNCFKTSIFGKTHVFVSSIESAKSILNNESGKFTKRYIKSIAELVGDQSILCASHQHHKLIRGRLINMFSTQSMSLFIKHFDGLILKTLNAWECESTVIVMDEALKITFKAMCKMLMSLEDEQEIGMLQKHVSQVCEAMLAFPLKFPWTRFYKGIQARKIIMSKLEMMISERRKGIESSQEDFLQQLLKEDVKTCSLNEPPRQTDTEIQDNILTMIIAGQDTTASAITWMVKYLGENQKVLDALRVTAKCVQYLSHPIRNLSYTRQAQCIEKQILDNRKIKFTLSRLKFTQTVHWSSLKWGGVGSLWLHRHAEQLNIAKTLKKSFLTLEDLNEMSYASQVVKESLRMASVVPWFPRVVLEDCEIEGYKIKRGWNVNIDARSIHLDPTVYKDPNNFNPSRFNDESKPNSFLAFGMGGRTCLGMNMAKSMMLVFLHRLVTTYKWKVTNLDSSIEKWALFSKLKSGCPIYVTHIMDDEKPT